MQNTLCASALAVEADQLESLILAVINTAQEAGYQRGAGLPVYTAESRDVAAELATKAQAALWRAFYEYTSHVAEAVAR